ncbi:hypothetical protein GPJ55_21525 [Bacillus subtilis]|nr:hypothetical protein GPJ55_21525 [Bacillus subtilis]
MELGISTFVETTPDFQTGKTVSHAQRIREVVDKGLTDCDVTRFSWIP